ncbi:MAG TPA: serine/threonine-protein kinase [Labilithrix sp.]|nr:serine/threonine-protein kinase [Labilithrix sp.]
MLLALDDGLDPVRLRFLAEARRVASLQDPNVVAIREVGVTTDGHPFLVREASSGESLGALLDRLGSLPTESAVDVAIAVCEALASAHALGIVHGELSPAAVRLAWSDAGPATVKIVDLGISRALAMLPLDARAMETLSISAPELLQSSREPDHRSDAWGVGVLLYTMLAGAPPFAADSPSTVNLSVALDEPAMLAGVPDGLGDLVDACLARDPAHRPGTMAVLASKLAPFGSRPVFAKRSASLVVDTGPYEALVLETLVQRAASPSLSLPPDEVLDRKTPVAPLATAPDKTPEPSVVSTSVAPLAISVAPLRPSLAASLAAAPAKPRASRKAAFAAAACVAVGVVIGVGSTRLSREAPAAAGIVAAPPPPLAEAPLPSPPRVEAPVATAPAAIAVSALRAAPLPAAPRARAAGGTPRAAPAPAAPPPAAPVDPLVRSAAAAPLQPTPKASDDDLRRFLDDRR